MKTEGFTIVHDEAMQTGECPVWHPVESALYWVDIEGKTVHRLHPASGKHSAWQTPTEPSAVAPDEDNNLIVATRAGLLYLNTVDGSITELAAAPYDTKIQRFNDGRVDPAGRFWVGTIYEPRDHPRAEMHVFEKGRLRQASLAATTNSNGLAWSPDGKTMYHADTTSHRVDCYDYDARTGTPANGRNLVTFEADKTSGTYGGRPDGAAMDSEGNYWVCMFEGGRILKLSPTGELLQQIDLPLRCPTCIAFGGPDLRTLYVTSAAKERSNAELEQFPASGKVLAFAVDVAGLPQPEYRD
ncbi:SMP-30/gluconolactonase/LRE family protein [Massilia sp. 9096]|uniref:SMP-30/gluconolactonase/LRE family protein n=1 Tax=Massilia sp. 9096 TaxID=1500894 RepID=UPI00056616ED|nr:SMP-30/gluconolactonase/LRE family protein [Massilia sp. 9096]